MIKDGPLKTATETLRTGTIRQRLSTLYVTDGMLVEETVDRVFSSDGDYIDSVTTTPLPHITEHST
jgi:hypothetical protein